MHAPPAAGDRFCSQAGGSSALRSAVHNLFLALLRHASGGDRHHAVTHSVAAAVQYHLIRILQIGVVQPTREVGVLGETFILNLRFGLY